MIFQSAPMLSIFHPSYINNMNDWMKYRLTYAGGTVFIQRYLKPLLKRETPEEFAQRRQMTYCPAFAKAAINEIKNAVIQRLPEVSREGGPISYQLATEGFEGGVDKIGNSMNSYLARHILEELLVMARVGIFVDMPQLAGPTIADKGKARPYLYMYRTEQIRSWTIDSQNPDYLSAVFLEDYQYNVDLDTGLTNASTSLYRFLYLNDQGTVSCQFFNESGFPIAEPIILDVPHIPFIILELSSSLLADVADYQIALLNLESTDLMYALKANFPFYTEQFDPRTISTYLKPAESAGAAQTEEVKVGSTAGRRYPIGTERPGFINPSPDPLKVSMDKAEQLKKDIRALVNLSVQNLSPRRASADSKIEDERPLESGLATIGSELEYAERRISTFWSEYEGSVRIATVNYPEDYSLKSDEEKKEEAAELEKLIPQIPSKTFQREASKRIVNLTIGSTISKESLDKIYKEIDTAPAVYSDPKAVTQDLESGLVSLDTASRLRGYPAGEVEKAKEDHAERLARIAAAQTTGIQSEAAIANKKEAPDGIKNPSSRGVKDLSVEKSEGRKEKQLHVNGKN